MNENGKSIILKDREYTIFEHDTLGIPYRLVDENNNRYFLQLKDDRSDKYYLLNGVFATKDTVTKQELEEAINPKPKELVFTWSGFNTGSSGGIINAPFPKVKVIP